MEDVLDQDMLEDEPVRWVRAALVEWLDREVWDPAQLIDWLQGYGLPAVGHEDEPFLWLLRGLPLGDERYSREVELARRAAKILREMPDVKRPGEEPNRLLCNLFFLCAGLGCPDSLTEPLLAVFVRRKLKGEWLGVSARDALRAALTANQIDSRLESVWQDMVAGKRHGLLNGNRYDGLQGIRLMPPSPDHRGEPAWHAIGRALKVMADRLAEEPGGDVEFRSLMTELTTTYPGERWDIRLLAEGAENDWPTWAYQHLPGEYAQRVYDKLYRYPFQSARGRKNVVHSVLIDLEATLGQGVSSAHPLIAAWSQSVTQSAKALAVGTKLTFDELD